MAVKVADTIEPMGQGSFPVVAASNVSGLAAVATTGDYNDLINTPGSGTNSEYAEKIGTDTSHPAIGSTSLPVYVNNAGEIKEITQLTFNDVNITPKSGGMVQQLISLPTDYWADPATSAEQIGINAWLYLQTLSAATITDNIFKVYLNNVEYHIGSELTNTNLQNICPNATSVSVSSAYQLYDASNTLLTGFGFVAIPDLGLVTDYIPVADGTIFSGSTYPTAFASFSYMGNGTTPVVESKVQVNTVEAKLIQNLANINSNHLTLEADHINTTQYNILNSITNTISDSGGSCHYGGIANFSYNTPLAVHANGTTYTGIWYPFNADYPGYGDIHLAYDHFGYLPYCYFTNKIVLLNAGNMCFLLIDGSVYSSIGNADYLEASSDSIDGKMTISGQLTVTGNDSTITSDRGKITCNNLSCSGTAISQALETQGIQVGNASSNVSISDDSITIEGTTITKSTLEALIDLINNGTLNKLNVDRGGSILKTTTSTYQDYLQIGDPANRPSAYTLDGDYTNNALVRISAKSTNATSGVSDTDPASVCRVALEVSGGQRPPAGSNQASVAAFAVYGPSSFRRQNADGTAGWSTVYIAPSRYVPGSNSTAKAMTSASFYNLGNTVLGQTNEIHQTVVNGDLTVTNSIFAPVTMEWLQFTRTGSSGTVGGPFIKYISGWKLCTSQSATSGTTISNLKITNFSIVNNAIVPSASAASITTSYIYKIVGNYYTLGNSSINLVLAVRVA